MAKAKALFLDSSFAIALINPKDQHHTAAAVMARKLLDEATRLVTTDAVIFEIANALSKRRHRKKASAFLTSLISGEEMDVVSLTPLLFAEAFELYQSRDDKDWSLTDCLSFIVMSRRGLTEALTNDGHFEQAGFVSLLQ